jgi:hypothetical protein
VVWVLETWRLIQNPNSLATKILKNYYPNEVFLEVHMDIQPSYIWRSLWNARKLLVEGLIVTSRPMGISIN